MDKKHLRVTGKNGNIKPIKNVYIKDNMVVSYIQM